MGRPWLKTCWQNEPTSGRPAPDRKPLLNASLETTTEPIASSERRVERATQGNDRSVVRFECTPVAVFHFADRSMAPVNDESAKRLRADCRRKEVQLLGLILPWDTKRLQAAAPRRTQTPRARRRVPPTTPAGCRAYPRPRDSASQSPSRRRRARPELTL